MEAIEAVQDAHIEGRCRGALLGVAPDVEALMTVPAASQAMDSHGEP